MSAQYNFTSKVWIDDTRMYAYDGYRMVRCKKAKSVKIKSKINTLFSAHNIRIHSSGYVREKLHVKLTFCRR